MADLIETRVIRNVIERLKERADRRRSDALTCPALGSIYTGMAHITDELVAELEDVLVKNTLRTAAEDPAKRAEGGEPCG